MMMMSTELLALVLSMVLGMRASSSSGAETEQGTIVRTLSQHLGFVTLPSLAKVTLPHLGDCKMTSIINAFRQISPQMSSGENIKSTGKVFCKPRDPN